jgi:hypothetical protein
MLYPLCHFAKRRNAIVPAGLRKLCLIALVLAATIGRAASQDQVLRWHDNLEQGAAAARESGKPLLVVFRCVR